MTEDTLSSAVAILYDKFHSWREVGNEIALEAADRGTIDTVDGHPERYGSLANALYRGVIDDSPKLRRALGLPPATVTVPPDMVKKRKPSKRSRTRIRSAVHHGYGDEGRAHRERMRTWLAGMGYESLTEYVEAQIDAI